jgi:adenosylcobinamide amidohydrolase
MGILPAGLGDERRAVMETFSVLCAGPILVAEFAVPQTVLSWSLTRPGFVTVRKVAWLHVRNDDLSLGVDPARLLETRMAAAGHADAVHLMTSRHVERHHLASAVSGAATAACLATVGLGNAARVGAPPQQAARVGTINLLAHVDRPLSQAALIEAVSIATEARTAAIIDLDWRQGGNTVTGTGTDCIAVAASSMDGGDNFAGLHTDIGAAIGRAVYDAVSQGGALWVEEQRELATAVRP